MTENGEPMKFLWLRNGGQGDMMRGEEQKEKCAFMAWRNAWRICTEEYETEREYPFREVRGDRGVELNHRSLCRQGWRAREFKILKI